MNHVKITSYNDLVSAVEVICEQGEGLASSPPPSPPFTPSEFMVPDDGDRLVGFNSDPPDQAKYSHFGRFLAVQNMALTSSDVYSGTANTSSAENQTLQSAFASLLTTLNALWTGGSGNIWAMTNLLTGATAVWKAGTIPQWTPEESRAR